MASLVGQVLLVQYRVDAFIASGGMGAVYRVWDLKRNVPLAMKVLHADLADDPSIFKRFQREARALERLAHPNIVPFYGLFHAGDLAFLLERFIDGPSLKDILRSRKGSPMPVDEALVYLKAVSSALGYAHAHGVVHCDVKPGNVMVDRGGSIYLTDFGVARHAESTTTTLGFAGTAGYMAPEQVRGDPVSPATDVYALGVMLYEMLTGERPFRGDERETEGKGSTGAERVRWAHLHLPPPDPRLKNPSLPPKLALVIRGALEKEPPRRHVSVWELYQQACQTPDTVGSAIPDRAKANPHDYVSTGKYVRQVKGNAALSRRRDAAALRPYKHLGRSPTWITMALVACVGLLAVLGVLLIRRYLAQDIRSRTQGGTSSSGATDGLSGTESIATGDARATTAVAQVSNPPWPSGAAPGEAYDFAFIASGQGGSRLFIASSDDMTLAKEVRLPEQYAGMRWPSWCGDVIYLQIPASGSKGPSSIVKVNPSTGEYKAWRPMWVGSVDLITPSCSPGGDLLAYAADQDGFFRLEVFDLRLNQIVFSTSQDWDDQSNYSSASWPQDTDLIAFMETGKTYHTLWRLRLGPSAEMREITPLKSPREGFIHDALYPSLSPTASEIAFVCNIGEWGLCVSNLSTGETRLLQVLSDATRSFPNEMLGTPSWSPDGEWLLFTAQWSGTLDIFRVRPDGSDVMDLTEGWMGNEEMPTWRR